MNWWRAHHGIANDPKIALVAMSRHVTPCHARRCDVLAVWVSLLDFASQNQPRGSIQGFEAEQFAWFLEMPPEMVLAIIEGFRDRGMISAANMLTAWDKRQPARERDDPGAADRKRKQRDKQRENGQTGQDIHLARAQQTGASSRAGQDSREVRNTPMFENGNVTPSHTKSPTEERRGEEKEEREERESALAETEALVAEATERLYANHPKKKNLVLVPDALLAAVSGESNVPEAIALIEKRHAAWCQSEQWTENGGRFAPRLDEWISDRGYTAIPPDSKPPEKKPPTIDPSRIIPYDPAGIQKKYRDAAKAAQA